VHPRIPAAALIVTALLTARADAQDYRTMDAFYRGWYAGGGVGANFLEDNDVRGNGTDSTASYNAGVLGILNFGYAFGNGFRAEVEPGYRWNEVDKVNGASGSGQVETGSLMLNGLYDFNFGWPVVPHVGAGIGYAHVWNRSSPHNGHTLKSGDDTFGYQAIAGVEYPLSPKLRLGLDYRYFVAQKPNLRVDDTDARATTGDLDNHAVLFTVRYAFGAPPPPAPPPQPAAVVPPPTPAPPAETRAAPPPPRQFTVYFAFNRADLDRDATAIVDQAATAARQSGVTRINLVGHADTAGNPSYNQRISERRAQAVRSELVRQGVPADAIATVGRGESELAVPTPDGVREPRNRRVEIVLQAPGA
jgi:outer membrane protein OmpA-like peptidoglycan-associated protein